MKKFKYLKFSKTLKLRYIDNYFEKKLYLIFLPGFMSDIEGRKPQFFKIIFKVISAMKSGNKISSCY